MHSTQIASATDRENALDIEKQQSVALAVRQSQRECKLKSQFQASKPIKKNALRISYINTA